MPYQKPGQRGSGQGTDYRAQSNPVYCEKEEFFSRIAALKKSIESSSNAERRRIRQGPRENRSKRVKNRSFSRYLNLAGASQSRRNATNRKRLMGRKHRLEMIGVGLLGECVRGRAVRVVGGWGEQGAGYKGAGRPLPRGGDGEEEIVTQSKAE